MAFLVITTSKRKCPGS